MQVDGVQVNAVEWWDPHWVKDRVLSKMGEDLAPSDAPAPAVHRKKKRR
jgi:hypothetical protein